MIRHGSAVPFLSSYVLHRVCVCVRARVSSSLSFFLPLDDMMPPFFLLNATHGVCATYFHLVDDIITSQH